MTIFSWLSCGKRILVTGFCLFLMLWFMLMVSARAAEPFPPASGARATDRLQQLVERASRPGEAGTQLTLIVETIDETRGNVAQVIASSGGQLRYQSGNRYQVRIRADRVRGLLAGLPATSYVRLPWPHVASAVVSQGVAISGANDMHQLGYDGTGIKVGIIDLGFGSYTSAQANGDLPATLTVTDYTGTGTGGSIHGTLVAEVVYDMAPGAELYLAKINTSLELEQAVNDMVSAGVDVINHSVNWFAASFYDGTGPFCTITNTAESAGILWTNSTGNQRNQHYLGTFSDVDGDLGHEFATGQNYDTVSLGSGKTVTLILNWDAYPTTNVDYNLYLYNVNPDTTSNPVAVASSTSLQGNGAQKSSPVEVLSYTAPVSGTYYIVVEKKSSSTANLPLTLFSLSSDLSVKSTNSSLSTPSECGSAVAVGATSLSDSPEGFSGAGPTTDGRNKPEISGPDGVQTFLASSFVGTSAASPHVAGAAALVMDLYPGFSKTQVLNELLATAHDVSTPGFDFRTGSGRLSLDADGDGVNHDDDNCPVDSNVSQTDTDADSLGDACDSDDDNDGLSDTLELSIGTNTLLADTDGDTLSDYDEVAWDGDDSAYTPGLDLNPNSMDTDGDGLPDATDPAPLFPGTLAGDVAPLGAPNGILDAADYLIALRIVLGDLQATSTELAGGDVYPPGAPDGVIDSSDLVVILGLILPN